MTRNAATGRSYSGINVLLLWGAVIERGYAGQTWLTVRPALGLGGIVRKGERGTTVVFADKTERFGAAVAASAAVRSSGHRPETVVLAVAERAQAFQVDRDAQHAGWLLLSIELELRNERRSFPHDDVDTVGLLLREVEEIGRELIRRGTKELAEG